MLIYALLFAAAGCKKDDAVDKPKEINKLEQSMIAGVNGPTTGAVNQELVFSIVWQNADSTARFDHLKDSTIHNTKIIKLYAITNVLDTAVVAAKDMNTVSYKFKAKTAGTYYLKFYKADNSDKTAIIDTLNIK
jgi:hypothetical protein